MAKRIIFTPGIDAMQGAFYTAQQLRYAEHNNAGYYSPVGRKNRARNYRAGIIGMRDSGTGRTRFAIRTKSTLNMTSDAKMAMSLLGGAAASYAAFLKAEGESYARELYDYYIEIGEILPTTTMRAFYMPLFKQLLKSKSLVMNLYGRNGTRYTLRNAFMFPQTPYQIKKITLTKFFDLLNDNPKHFYFEGMTGISSGTLTWGAIVQGNWNVVGFSTIAKTSGTYIAYHGAFIVDASDNFVKTTQRPVDGANYYISDEEPI